VLRSFGRVGSVGSSDRSIGLFLCPSRTGGDGAFLILP
jgi:hypothetical protein